MVNLILYPNKFLIPLDPIDSIAYYAEEETVIGFFPADIKCAEVGLYYDLDNYKVYWAIKIGQDELAGNIEYDGDPSWLSENGLMVANTIFETYYTNLKNLDTKLTGESLKIRRIKEPKKQIVQEYTW